MQAVDVCIRGAGAVGMSLALALSRQGLSVALCGRDADGPGGPDIRAYALNAASRRVLRELKVWDALPADAVCAVHDMRVAGDAPGAEVRFSGWSQAVEALAWIVDAGELEAGLRLACRFAPHVQWVDQPAPAGLQVLAEGRDSATREALGVRFDRQAYHQRGLAARVISDRPHQGVARQWFRSPDILALLPFDRPQPGCSYGLVWSLPDAQADAMQALSPDAFEAELNAATGGAAGRLSLHGERAAWPLALARAEPWVRHGWALVGDAAHLVHPLSGQGLNLGLGDVEALARVLSEREPWRPLGDERLLRRYVRERAMPTWAMGRMTDGLLNLFAQRDGWVRELRNRGMTLVDNLPVLKRALARRAIG